MNADQFTSPPRQDWIEIFYSRPSWTKCFIVYKADDAAEFTENGVHTMTDAEHIREGFRVFRIRGVHKLQVALTNGTARQWDDNSGHYHHIEGPGRYVISGGVRRVDNADAEECERSLRQTDNWIELLFEATLWEKCYCSYAKDDSEDWVPAPGEAMQKSPDTGEFSLRIPARKLVFAFNNGGEYWDNNGGRNFRVGLPGKYKVQDGAVQSRGVADADVRGEKPPPPSQKAAGISTTVGTAKPIAGH